MSDFVGRDTIYELWQEILQRHWNYFDSEESINKLENRKKLEDCLKKFVCIVQHDRKFFLPETSRVLKKSIQDLDGFSAQKAITAFESISQYANNLFTKPWRKEFRILKMYSGFFQHEIKSNLLDAEILFEAMGYRRLSEDTLILDGPICPDQVGNVSRDAMIAYVELQIIKHIYTGLDAIGLNCSWLDIYHYREKYTGGTSQAVKALAYAIDEKRFRSRQKTSLGDNYGYIDVQPSANYFETNTQFCPAQCQCSHYQQVPAVSRRRLIAQPNGICSVPEHQQQSLRTATNLVYSNMACAGHYQHNHQQSGDVPLPHMSHSRSLEHYTEPDHHNHKTFLHRHSFDQQQEGCTAHNQYSQQQQYHQHLNQPPQHFYESPYDCIDGSSLGGGSSTISYAAITGNAVARAATTGEGGGGIAINCNLNSSSTYSHPYNVSGNRFPLPLNISHQLSAYDNLQSSNYNGPQEPTYAHITDQHMYSSVSKLPQNCMLNVPGYNQSSNNVHGLQTHLLAKDSFQRQRSCQPEQLINLEDTTIMQPHITQQQQFDQYRQNCETSNYVVNNHYNMRNNTENSIPPPDTSTCQQHCVAVKPPPNDETYVYAKPTPKENRKHNALSLRKYPYHSAERGDTTDISYESANDDFVNNPSQDTESNDHSSPTQFTKNQDGVGSIETWNYVYQNLEKNGYSKDLGERKDLLVESLDLDSLNINNDASPSQIGSTEKRKLTYFENEKKTTTNQQQQHQHQQLERKPQKGNTSENGKYLAKNNTAMEVYSTNNIQKQKNSVDNNTKKIKSALKQTNATSKSNTNINPNPNHHPNKSQIKTKNDNKTKPKTMNNNNNDTASTNPGNGTTQRKTSSKKSQAVEQTNYNPLSTQTIAASIAKEWSCSFCTFLNPIEERICEMCCRTKDRLDSSTSSTTTGRTTATHNTPTCA